MNDPQIRELLRPHLAGGVVVDELPVGTTRADVTHITPDLMHGYELKGDGDTLKRVPMQLESYCHAFDRVTFVVTAKHVDKIGKLLPEWAGLAVVDDTGITTLAPAVDHGQLSREQLLALLWTSEIREFLAARGYDKLSRLRTFEFFTLVAQETSIPLVDVAAFTRQRLIDRMPQRMAQRAGLKAQRERVKEYERERQTHWRMMEEKGRQLLSPPQA